MSLQLRISGRKTGGTGRVVGSLFFSVFAGMGLVFCGLVAKEFAKNAKTYTWQRTECAILESRVVDRKDSRGAPYEFAVKYQYRHQGRDYTSDRFSTSPKTYSAYDEARQWAERFPADTKRWCYVDGNDPSQSVLKRGNLWLGLAILLPLLFVAIGLGGIYAMWRKGAASDETAARQAPVTQRRGWSSAFLVCFFLVFLLVGLAAGFFLGVRPLYQVVKARGWVATPCTIVSSRVQTHSSDDGATYSVDILYSYEFNGQEYKAGRYHFAPGSTSGHGGKAAIVRRYPPGLKTTCFVNPRSPGEAVLHRGFSSQMWWGILFPIPFVAVGAGGLFFGLRRNQGGASRAYSWRSKRPLLGIQETIRVGSVPLILRPGKSRLLTLLGVILMAAFWNGIVSVFFVQVVQSWRLHRPSWFLTLFLVPFVAVGLLLLGMVGYQLLALFNPRVVLALGPGTPRPGAGLPLRWELFGRLSRIQRLRIFLEGREEVSYQRGTRTATDKHVFATIELVDTPLVPYTSSGQTELKIPADTMHSFSARHNKIVWALRVQGEIPNWPDINDQYSLEVLPR